MRLRRFGWVLCIVLLGILGTLKTSSMDADAAEAIDFTSFVFLPTISSDFVSPAYRICRFGVGGNQSIASYDIHALKLGWYVDWGASLSPSLPGGIDYMPMVRLSQTGPSTYSYSPSGAQIKAIATDRPGQTWLIGNEPDRIVYQDDLEPDVYAMAYHELYELIKSADPSAKVAIGGIVQPTPLRLRYLDMVLDAYLNTYGAEIPVDVWNIHAFVLREEAGSWGAEIPPGIDAQYGELYEIDDNANVELFIQGIERFRNWMASKGYQNRPLIITEFGVQMPADLGFPPERVGAFMHDTFDYMMTATDPDIGYPADKFRLVQQWAWWSLSENEDTNGWLFDPDTRVRTVHGDNFAGYTANVSGVVNLEPIAIGVDYAYSDVGEVVSATVTATIVNNGNMESSPTSVHFYAGRPQQDGILIADETLWKVPGCATIVDVVTIWDQPTSDEHMFYVIVDPGNLIAEADESDNWLSTSSSSY